MVFKVIFGKNFLKEADPTQASDLTTQIETITEEMAVVRTELKRIQVHFSIGKNLFWLRK